MQSVRTYTSWLKTNVCLVLFKSLLGSERRLSTDPGTVLTSVHRTRATSTVLFSTGRSLEVAPVVIGSGWWWQWGWRRGRGATETGAADSLWRPRPAWRVGLTL